MKKLQGKVAIITGGGQGIGLGIATAMADAGADIVLTGRTAGKVEAAAAGLKHHGVRAIGVAADVGKRENANHVAAEAMKAFGRIDILVNAAQSSTPGIKLEDIAEEQWESTLQSGLFGSFYFMQACLPHLKVNGGKIINFGSREGMLGTAGFGAYATTKEGIRALSRVAAREWGAYNIQVNVICPAALTEPAIRYFEANPEMRDYYLNQIAAGRFGDPEKDIGRVAVFLAGSDSDYVTGQTINVDGGQVML